MNTHKNARLTFARRLELVQSVTEQGLTYYAAAATQGVTEPTARKWVGRFLVEGEAGLRDHSSRPRCSPRALDHGKALLIVQLRQRRLTMQRIAQDVGCSQATVSRVCARARLSSLASIEPAIPVQRYEHQHPGDLVHIDIKKLGRIERVGHRITGRHSKRIAAGWEFLFVGIDDHARVGVTQLHSDERVGSAIHFLDYAVRYFANLGVTVRRVMTDNGGVFRAKAFKRACDQLQLKHVFTRPYRPQTNGKAERFIQSALREWAYAFVYTHSSERHAMLQRWTHQYNWHRPHQGIGGIAPMHRLSLSENNLLQVHT
jgi:transposase InsO family protein